MKKLLALCTAVVLVALMGATTAAAQTSGPDAPAYTPSIPQHEGLNDDGSVSLDFSGTGFLPNQTITVTVMGQSVPVLIGADGTGTYPASGPSLAGKSVLFTGQVVEDPDGEPRTSAGKSFPAIVEPTPVPTQAPIVQVVTVPVVQPAELGDPATAMVTTKITTPRNLPAAPVARTSSPSVPLALTGAETSVPVMIGSALILVGGLAIVASRRRAESI